MDAILQDLRYELRTLIKSPRFTSIALVTLVLGIAANVAIFTFVDATLIHPLPYRDSSRLMEIYDTRTAEVFSRFESSYPDFLDWRSQQEVFDGLASYSQNRVLLRGQGTPELLPAATVTDNFFQTLGVQPVAGRDFRAGEDLAAAPRTVMLSYGWWQRRFGGKDVTGQVLNIDDHPDRKSTRLNSSHLVISYAVFCLKKKNNTHGDGQPGSQEQRHVIGHVA